MEQVEEDVQTLQFGPDFTGEDKGVEFMSNASAAILLKAVVEKKYADRNPPEVFTKAFAYAKKFPGAVEISDVAGVDQLFTELSNQQFDREEEETREVQVGGYDGSEPETRTITQKVKRSYKFDKYEITALANLHPPSLEAARALIPSLSRYTDTELLTVMEILARATTRMSLQVGLAGSGPAAGGLGMVDGAYGGAGASSGMGGFGDYSGAAAFGSR